MADTTQELVEEILVQVVVTTRNAQGQTMNRQLAEPVALFRATTPDVWADCDKRLKELQKGRAAAEAAQPKPGFRNARKPRKTR